jgi:hypothetical protein
MKPFAAWITIALACYPMVSHSQIKTISELAYDCEGSETLESKTDDKATKVTLQRKFTLTVNVSDDTVTDLNGNRYKFQETPTGLEYCMKNIETTEDPGGDKNLQVMNMLRVCGNLTPTSGAFTRNMTIASKVGARKTSTTSDISAVCKIAGH